MSQKENVNLVIENARIIFRNFSGYERAFNSEGDRNFSVILEPKLAQKLTTEGWRVKQLKSREEGEEGDYHLKVTVNYKKGRPPRCVMVTSRGRSDLGADEVPLLDAADIKNVDLIINGWWSDMAGGGYSGFLKSIFVTIEEDELDLKYADVQDAVPAGSNSTDEED